MKTQIKKQILEATKARDTTTKDILKVVVGDVDTQESRTGKPMTDEQIQNVIKKTLEGVEEMLKYKEGDEKLLAEKNVLEALLPNFLTVEQILDNLADIADQIKNAKNEGQAMGITMKFLKGKNLPVNGNDVKSAIQAIREGN